VDRFEFFAVLILSGRLMECYSNRLLVYETVSVSVCTHSQCYYIPALSVVAWKLCKAISSYFTAFAQETRATAQCGHLCAVTYNSEENHNFRGSFSAFYSSRSLAMKNSRKAGRRPPDSF
jgi:hypothetical protein